MLTRPLPAPSWPSSSFPDVFQEHQVDVAVELKATQERIDARIEQVAAQADPQRTNSPPRKVHIPRPALDLARRLPIAQRRFLAPSRALPASPRLPLATPRGPPLTLPTPRTALAFRKWLFELVNAAPDFPNEFEQMILPSQDFASISLSKVKDATEAAGLSLDPDAEVVKAIPRFSGRTPHGIYDLANETVDTPRLTCTAFSRGERLPPPHRAPRLTAGTRSEAVVRRHGMLWYADTFGAPLARSFVSPPTRSLVPRRHPALWADRASIL